MKQQLALLEPEELRTIVREEITAALDARASNDNREPELLTAGEVGDLLGYSRSYVIACARRHGLPFEQRGKGTRLFFRKAAVLQWVSRRKRSHG